MGSGVRKLVSCGAVVGAFALGACSKYPIVSEYGDRTYRAQQAEVVRYRAEPHIGVDFAAKKGTDVLAVADGVVQEIYRDDRGLLSISVRHYRHRRFSRYDNLGTTSVMHRMRVRRGQKLGTVGDRDGYDFVHLGLADNACACSMELTEDPLRYDAGCFDPDKEYARDEFVLTWPVPCP